MANPIITVITLNVRGMVNAAKRDKINIWLSNQSADVIFLQELHCTSKNVRYIENSWKGKSFFSLSKSPFSKGVGIFFCQKLDVNVIDEFACDDGRTLIMNMELCNKTYTLVNVYAPNKEKERINYFQNLEMLINRYSKNKENLIIAGDMNCCLNEDDRSTNTHENDQSRTIVKNLAIDFNVTDTWKEQNIVTSGNHFT